MNLLELWHYPRQDLASRYLDMLNLGLTTSTTIFAPRRTGKTSFLRRDITPEAEERGYLVVYADLWQTKQSPGLALLHALKKAAEPKTFSQKVKSAMKKPVKKLSAKAKLGPIEVEGSTEFEAALEKFTTADLALLIDKLLGELTLRQPVLLLIDEAQELARTKDSEAIATALRTAMTTYSARLRVIFTGSSRTKLANVFADTKAPLYSTGMAIQAFPLLDDGFVEFVAKKYYASTRQKLPDTANKYFEALGRYPEPFLRAVISMILDPRLSLKKAVEMQQQDMERSENHEGAWSRLDASQQFVVKLLASNPDIKIYSAEIQKLFKEKLGLKTGNAKLSIQYALRRLAADGIIVKSARNTYEFENEAFAKWVRTLAD